MILIKKMLLPATQTAQSACFSLSWYVPGGHGSGAALPCEQKWPEGHGKAVSTV